MAEIRCDGDDCGIFDHATGMRKRKLLIGDLTFIDSVQPDGFSFTLRTKCARCKGVVNLTLDKQGVHRVHEGELRL